jgi:hypothetical protein
MTGYTRKPNAARPRLDLKVSMHTSPMWCALISPTRVAKIDAAIAEVEAGNTFTAEQVREHFKQKRAAWAQKNGPD